MKRSAAVTLVLIGVVVYAASCSPVSRRWGGYRSGRPYYGGGWFGGSRSASPAPLASPAGSVTHGGFGSTGHAISGGS